LPKGKRAIRLSGISFDKEIRLIENAEKLSLRIGKEELESYSQYDRNQ